VETKRFSIDIGEFPIKVKDKTIRRKKYKAVTVEVPEDQLPELVKQLLAMRGEGVKIRAKLQVEVEVDTEALKPKIFRRKTWEVEPGKYIFYVKGFISDEEYYDVYEVVITPGGKVKVRRIERFFGLFSIDKLRSKYGEIPSFFEVKPFKIAQEVYFYVKDCLEKHNICPLCGSKVLHFTTRQTYIDDYTIIVNLIYRPETEFGINVEVDERQMSRYKCLVCGAEYTLRKYTEDAGGVLNWSLEVKIGDKVYYCSKDGPTGMDTLFEFYKQFLKFAVDVGLIRVAAPEPLEVLNRLMPLEVKKPEIITATTRKKTASSS